MIAAPEKQGDVYSVQLTDYQKGNTVRATYTVILDIDNGYYPALSDAPATIDESGNVDVPADPALIVAETDGGAGELLLGMAYESGDDRSARYGTDKFRLAATPDLGPRGFGPYGLLAGFDDLDLQAEFETGSAEASTVVFSRQDAPYPLGVQVTEAQMAMYKCVGYLWGASKAKTRAEDGSMAPIADWEKADFLSDDGRGFSDSFQIKRLPASSVGGRFSLQICLEDAEGNLHGSEVVQLDLLESEEPEAREVKTDRGTLTFELNGGDAVLAKYEGDDEKIVIPGKVGGAAVTSIGGKAFYGNEYVREIELPDSITEISEEAFCGSALTRFEMPEHLQKLGDAAFAHMGSLEEFAQGGENGVTSVRDGVLFSADGKTLLAYPSAKGAIYDVPDGVSAIGYAAFAGAAVTRVNMPESVKSIEPCAFISCQYWESIGLPENLERIGSEAFGEGFSFDSLSYESAANIRVIHVGPRVSYIGRNAFGGLPLESIEVDGKNKWYASKGGFLLSAEGALVQAPASVQSPIEVPEGVTSLPSKCLYGAEKRKDGSRGVLDVFLPNSLTSIAEDAFSTVGVPDEFSITSNESKCAAVLHVPEGSWAEGYARENGIDYDNKRDAKELSFSETVVETDTAELTFRVFSDHAQLVGAKADSVGHIEIPSRVDGMPVTVVGYEEWNDTVGIVKTVVIPETVERIEGRLLQSIQDARWFEVAEGNERFSSRDGVLYTADGEVLIACPSGVGELFTVPDGTREIGDCAFQNIDDLQSVVLPDGVERIGERAFDFAKSLQSVNFPSSLKSIGEEAFRSTALKEVRLNSGLQTIGMRAFDGCGGFDGLSIPDSVTVVGDSAFGDYSDEGLASTGSRELAIGAGLDRLEQGAFANLDIDGFTVSPNNAHFKADGPFLLSKDGRVLYACASGVSGELSVPEGVEAIESYAFNGVEGLTDLRLPASVLRFDSFIFGTNHKIADAVTLHCIEGSESAKIAEAQKMNWVAEQEVRD